jgi:hypothetical protein
MMRRLSIVLTAILSLVLVTGASVVAAPRPTLGKEFTVRVGQTVTISGEQLSLTFAKVTEDSRCPIGVVCIWEGNAQIAVTLSTPPNAPETILLNTNPSFPTTGTYLDYTVTLVDLKPYPRSTGPIPESRYRATLLVTRN